MNSSAAAAVCTATGAVQDGAGPCRVGAFARRSDPRRYTTTTTLTFIGPSVGVGASVLVALVGISMYVKVRRRTLLAALALFCYLVLLL